MKPPLRNDQLTLVALLVLGGDKTPVDTEEIAIEADKLSPGRFRWRKFKEHIDLGLVRNGLQDARKKELVSGGALKGWLLTTAGQSEAVELLPSIADPDTQIRITSAQRQWEARERSRILGEPALIAALDRGPEAVSERDIFRLFKIDEYATTANRAERIRKLLDAFENDIELGPVIRTLAERLSP